MDDDIDASIFNLYSSKENVRYLAIDTLNDFVRNVSEKVGKLIDNLEF